MKTYLSSIILANAVILLTACQSVPTTNQTISDRDDIRTSMLQTDIAIEYFKSNNLNHSMVAVQQALAKNPNNALAWMMLGMTYQADGNAENQPKAKSAFERAIKIDPNNPQIRNNYGQFLLKNRMTSQAVNEFKLAASVISYDNRESAYSNLGFAFLELAKQGNTSAKAAANSAFEKALSLSRGYEPALLGLQQLKALR